LIVHVCGCLKKTEKRKSSFFDVVMSSHEDHRSDQCLCRDSSFCIERRSSHTREFVVRNSVLMRFMNPSGTSLSSESETRVNDEQY
jgi:hypothetical protein